ncbi:MAG: GNAT family N-acetyltransferase [Actinomycetota bacterium]|nr:GNAT family N-acetyltransferase [Actinomycetota bacterium]
MLEEAAPGTRLLDRSSLHRRPANRVETRLGWPFLQAVCASAFADLDLPELISIVHPQNIRSQRVATKLGMTIERRLVNPSLGRVVDVWQLDVPRPSGVAPRASTD